MFAVIDRKSTIDSMTDDGHLLDTDTMGNIEFNNVSFNYPSRADVPVRTNLIEKNSLNSQSESSIDFTKFELENRGRPDSRFGR